MQKTPVFPILKAHESDKNWRNLRLVYKKKVVY